MTSTSHPVEFHLHYLKLTVVVDPCTGLQWLMQLIEATLISGSGYPLVGWQDRGDRRYFRLYRHAPGVHLLVSKEGRYMHVEVQGEAMDLLHPQAVQALLRALEGSRVRWRATRADAAFDHVPFTPAVVKHAATSGQFTRRCFKQADCQWIESSSGTTCYLGKRSRAIKKSRTLRVYDKRGFTRLELELHKPFATRFTRELLEKPVDQWHKTSLSHVRAAVDFVDRTAKGKPLLPWWALFVDGVAKASPPAEPDRPRWKFKASVKEQLRERRWKAVKHLLPEIRCRGAEYVAIRLAELAKIIGPRPCDLELESALRGLIAMSDSLPSAPNLTRQPPPTTPPLPGPGIGPWPSFPC